MAHALRIAVITLILVLLCPSYTSIAAAPSAPIVLEQESLLSLGKHLEYVKTGSSDVTLRQIMTLEPAVWTQLTSDHPNFGVTSEVYWLRFELHNPHTRTQELILHINYALLDYLDVYQIQKRRTINQHKTGDRFPFHQRPIAYPTFLFPIEIDPGATQQIYIKVATSGAMKLPMSLWQERAFFQHSQYVMTFNGIFLGIMLIMCCYNLMLYSSIRELSYFYYSLLALFTALTLGSFNGFTYQWLWPDYAAIHHKSTLYFNSGGFVVLTLFTYHFFPMKDYPRVRKLSKLLIGFSLVTLLSAIVMPYIWATRIQVINNIILISGTIFIGVYMIINRVKIARLFVLAWLFLLLGILVSSLSVLGVLPHNFFTYYTSFIGATLAVTTLSLALADRINAERSDKEQAQAQAILNLGNFQRLYENALEGIFTLNESGKVISANPRFVGLLGYKSLSELQSNVKYIAKLMLQESSFVKLLNLLKNQGKVIDFEVELTKANGEVCWVAISAQLHKDPSTNNVKIEGSLIDISDRKKSEEKLNYLATHDPLTQLFNRLEFEVRLLDAIENLHNKPDALFCVLYVDLDQFKLVNDTCGHTAGDQLLIHLTQRMLAHLKEENTLARLGGDEFGILVHTPAEQAMDVAESIRLAVKNFQYNWQNRRFKLGVSIGLVEVSHPGHTVQEILSKADTACFMAKDEGRNRICVFTEEDEAIQFRQREMDWISTLTKALEQDKFVLYGQMIHSNFSQGKGIHYEVLLRMQDEQGNIISPARFLPAAERYSLATPIDCWVINAFLTWLERNPEHLNNLELASINLSGASVSDKKFDNFLTERLAQSSVPANKICFEITESMAITKLDHTIAFINRYKQQGFRFALDDFGTGFSSYAYLKDLNVDYVKIDGVFVKDIVNDQVSLAMVKSIYEIAQVINIECIAEFVEDAQIQLILSQMGVHYSQGYGLHKPEPLTELKF